MKKLSITLLLSFALTSTLIPNSGGIDQKRKEIMLAYIEIIREDVPVDTKVGLHLARYFIDKKGNNNSIESDWNVLKELVESMESYNKPVPPTIKEMIQPGWLQQNIDNQNEQIDTPEKSSSEYNKAALDAAKKFDPKQPLPHTPEESKKEYHNIK